AEADCADRVWLPQAEPSTFRASPHYFPRPSRFVSPNGDGKGRFPRFPPLPSNRAPARQAASSSLLSPREAERERVGRGPLPHRRRPSADHGRAQPSPYPLPLFASL